MGDEACACQPIGIIRSPVTEPVDADWGKVVSEIRLRQEFAAGLQGLAGFSHVVIVFYMHNATFVPERDLVRQPQGRQDMPLVGIFAQRARHRPNPIGITAVKLLGVNGNAVTVQGLDAIDGTPVLDIKPYFPVYDRVAAPVVPAWVDVLMEDYF